MTIYSPTLHEVLAGDRLLKTVLWSVLTLSCAVFALLAHFISLESAGPAQSAEHLKLLGTVFAGVAIFDAAVAYAVRRFFRSSKGIEIASKFTRASAAPPDERTARLTAPEQRFVPYFRAQTVPLLVSLAMHESIAILGFILALSQRDPSAAYPLAGAAIILNLFIYPDSRKIFEQALPYLNNSR